MTIQSLPHWLHWYESSPCYGIQVSVHEFLLVDRRFEIRICKRSSAKVKFKERRLFQEVSRKGPPFSQSRVIDLSDAIWKRTEWQRWRWFLVYSLHTVRCRWCCCNGPIPNVLYAVWNVAVEHPKEPTHRPFNHQNRGKPSNFMLSTRRASMITAFRFGFDPGTLRIRDMRYRCANCSCYILHS